MPLKNSIKSTINVVSFEANIAWDRSILWLNIILIATFSLFCYKSQLYSENPYSSDIGRRENLYVMKEAIGLSSNIYVLILTITCVLTWTRILNRGILKTLLSLPISRKTFFICNILNIFIPPFIIFLSSHIFAGTYILNHISVNDLLLLVLLVLLQTLFTVSIATFTSLILKNGIITLFLLLSIFTLPSQFPELKYIDSRSFYEKALTYMWSLERHIPYIDAIKFIGITLSLMLLILMLSYIYFLKMDID